MSTGAAPSPAAPQPALSQAERVIDTFIAPSKTFTDIKRSASWWVPWLLTAVFSLLFVYAMDSKIGFERIAESAMRQNPRAAAQLDQLSPEQRQQRIDLGAKAGRIIAYCTPVIGLLFAVIIAALLMAAFNFGAGAQIGFATSLAVTMYASLPGVFKALIGTVALFAGVDPEAFNPQNPVASNLGSLVSMTEHPALFTIASSVDLFTIWTLVLLGLGYAWVSKLKRSTTLGVVIGIFVLYVLVRAGIAAI